MVPIYALSIYINHTSANHIKDKLIQSKMSQNQFFMSSFESEIVHLMELQDEFISDRDLHNFALSSATMGEFEKLTAILRIQGKLKMITGKYIETVNLYYPSLNLLISPNEINEPTAEQLESLQQSTVTVGPKMTLWNNKLLLGVPYQVGSDVHGQPFFLFGIELSIPKIEDALLKFIKANNGETAHFINVDENWIVSGNREDPDQPFINEYVKKHIRDNQTNHGEIEVNGEKYLAAYGYSNYINVALATYVPKERIFSPLKKYSFLVWLVSITVFFMLCLYSFWLYRLIHQPLHVLVRAARRMEGGDLDMELHYKKNDEFGYIYQQLNDIIGNIKVLIRENHEQKTLVQHAELKQLQAQINPHFLYNTYFILYRMARSKDTDNLITYTKYLGDYFKYITRNTFDEISLLEEVNHAKNYAKIQSVRFYHRIEVHFEDLPHEMQFVAIPGMLLQPILENAYEHGFNDTLNGGKLNIFYASEDDYNLIVVEDNGKGMTQVDIASTNKSLQSPATDIKVTGMINVHRRMRLKFGGESGVEVLAADSGGLRVVLRIPKS